MATIDYEQRDRRVRILQTAFELFCEHGIEKTSMKQVAQAARVGDMTLYRYFGSKATLVLNTLDILWDEIDRGIIDRVVATENYETMRGIEQIRVLINSLQDLYLYHSDFVRFSYEAKLYLVRHRIKMPMPVFDRMMSDIRQPCISAIERGKSDGSIPTEENSEDLFYAIWGSVRGYIVKIVLYDLLCVSQSPWKSRYPLLERGIISALEHGWK